METDGKRQCRLNILHGILRGEQAIVDGRTLSHKQARQKLKKWLIASKPLTKPY
ncbi:MAG: hypothetical protein ACFUZC_19860 [Chthoniobacteraceae bacterium]